MTIPEPAVTSSNVPSPRLRNSVIGLGWRADLLERAVTPVVEEQVRPDVAANDVEVDPSVAVVVTGRNSAGNPGGIAARAWRLGVPVLVREPGGGRDVRERPRARGGRRRPEQHDQQEAAGMHTALASGRRSAP